MARAVISRRKWMLMLLTMVIAVYSYGQQPGNLSRSVTLPIGLLRMDTIMSQVQRQTGLKFSFNSQQVHASRKITIRQPVLSVEEVLRQMEIASSLKFKIVAGHIILQNHPGAGNPLQQDKAVSAAAPKQPGTLPAQHPVKRKKTIPSVRSLPSQGNTPGKENDNLYDIQPVQHLPVNNTTGKTANTEMNVIDAGDRYAYIRQLLVSQLEKLDKPLEKDSDSANVAQKDTLRPRKRFWLAAGITADELFYPNARLLIGFRRLFAVVGWNNHSCACGLRYGAGYEMQLSRTWQLQTVATAGLTAATYPQSTTLPEVLVKNGLYKLGILAQKNITGRFSIQAGPVLNGLQTKYFSYDQQGIRQPVAVGALLPATMNADKTYVSVKPPYTFLNTYRNESSRNWKAWIGAELGIYYKINFFIKK